MAKNLVNGTNIVIEESGDNINMNLSSTYNTNLQQKINDSFKENNIYSTTEEQVIGTWIDGKPIYRKVISTIVSRILDELNSLNVDSVVDLKGHYDSDYDFNWEINSNVPEANYRFSIYRVKSTKAFNGSHGDFISGTNSIEVTIEYTKTTD